MLTVFPSVHPNNIAVEASVSICKKLLKIAEVAASSAYLDKYAQMANANITAPVDKYLVMINVSTCNAIRCIAANAKMLVPPLNFVQRAHVKPHAYHP
jgi:hypothetical protein